jgi:hypothetical protein
MGRARLSPGGRFVLFILHRLPSRALCREHSLVHPHVGSAPPVQPQTRRHILCVHITMPSPLYPCPTRWCPLQAFPSVSTASRPYREILRSSLATASAPNLQNGTKQAGIQAHSHTKGGAPSREHKCPIFPTRINITLPTGAACDGMAHELPITPAPASLMQAVAHPHPRFISALVPPTRLFMLCPAQCRMDIYNIIGEDRNYFVI